MKRRSLNLWSKTRRCPKEPNHEGKILDSWRDTRRHPHNLPFGADFQVFLEFLGRSLMEGDLVGQGKRI